MSDQSNVSEQASGSGLYLHIPYCAHLCRYCDFAKTANFDDELGAAYFASLQEHLKAWLLPRPSALGVRPAPFSSVFLGGGTPGLFSTELRPLFELIAPHLAPGAEVSIEANPANITPAAISAWLSCGINRISIGVQTFEQAGLTFLSRDHSAFQARQGVDLALAAFGNVNVDLIYGWEGQTAQAWKRDLAVVTDAGVPHLSLYNLTFEARTPLGRMHRRGLVQSLAEDFEWTLYDSARQSLAAAGFEHEEVSNWSRPGASCRHNWLYWGGSPSYIGIGAGAHGFVGAKGEAHGLRYSYPRSDRAFMRLKPPRWSESQSLGADLESAGVSVDERTAASYAAELVGSGLRTSRGVDLTSLEQLAGRDFRPTPTVQQAISQGWLTVDLQRRLHLIPAEWFREQAWSLEVLQSL